ncbi:hypothetical protein HBE96_23165 [Clostridium sp. P21]|uniref:Uncharacterized protein n=1 Tax=Clostridium muellerianum TaxID=2716538 RepID=A0A7Y0EL90_9CLOT|nr:hypothetical protein [Clostridium muellerianum]NMM65482.1 hypothetical protein [Clostridium muellerianum]
MILMESLNKAGYIYYETGYLPSIVDKNGRYMFAHKDKEEIQKIIKNYNDCVAGNKKIYVNLPIYNKCIFELKNLVKSYKVKKAQDIIFNDREFKFIWKKREECLNRVDEICDNILEKLEK